MVTGNNAKYVGIRLVESLQGHGVRVSESVEGPILTGTSRMEKMENGVSVFTLEVSDGAGLKIKEVVSSQDLLSSWDVIPTAADRVAEEVVKQLAPKQPPKPQPAPENYSTS